MSTNKIKTIYAGCDNNGEDALPEHSNIKFDLPSVKSYCNILCHFGRLYFRIQSLCQSGVISSPYKVCLFISDTVADLVKVKPENKFTILETIEWFILNLEPPKCGIIFTLYYYKDSLKHYIMEPWASQIIWPLKKEWQSLRDGDYITLQDIESNIPNDSRKGNYIRSHDHYNVIKRIDEISPYPVKRVCYAMGEEEVFKVLKHSKLHISYQGASYFAAAIINLPTIMYSYYVEDSYGKWWEDEKLHEGVVTGSLWNSGHNQPTSKVCQYDLNKESVIQKPQQFAYHVETSSELESIIKGLSEFKVAGKSYFL